MPVTDLLTAVKLGGINCLISGTWLLLILRIYPRLFLRHFPAEVRAVVPPLSTRERRLGLLAGFPFLIALIGFPAWAAYQVKNVGSGDLGVWRLSLIAFVTWSILNLFDWLIIDELILGIAHRTRASWLILPGTEAVPLRHDHAYHALGFVKGTIGGAFVSLLIGVAIAAWPL